MKYNILYVDPPWSYDNKKTGGSMKSGVTAKYPSMPLDDICKLPIPQVADKHAVLFLWATVPLLPEAIVTMDAWGFKYKTMLTWVKTDRSGHGRLGMGFWFRGQTEHLLIGIRGKVKPFRMQESNVVTLAPIGHSAKPERVRQLIDNATQHMDPQNKLEVFARTTTPGWTSIGNHLDNCDITESLASLTEGIQP